jgi:hypothetical protein
MLSEAVYIHFHVNSVFESISNKSYLYLMWYLTVSLSAQIHFEVK